MNNSDDKELFEICRFALSQIIELQAYNDAVMRTLLVLAKECGRDPEHLIDICDEQRKSLHEKALLEIETLNPWLAAILDQRDDQP